MKGRVGITVHEGVYRNYLFTKGCIRMTCSRKDVSELPYCSPRGVLELLVHNGMYWNYFSTKGCI